MSGSERTRSQAGREIEGGRKEVVAESIPIIDVSGLRPKAAVVEFLRFSRDEKFTEDLLENHIRLAVNPIFWKLLNWCLIGGDL